MLHARYQDTQPVLQPTIRKLNQDIQISIPEVQGDTGANCNATNNAEYLWDYRRIDPMGVSTFEGQADQASAMCAIGVGTMKIILDGTAVLECSTLHIPQANGTILSPDKIMMEQQAASFTHEGHRNGQGHISWKDDGGKEMVRIRMVRRKGLWFIDTPILLPGPELVVNKIAAKQSKQFEIWHQRMGHPSVETLRRTQKVVHGIPPIPSGIDQVFHCPSCAASKLTKAHHGPTATRQPFRQGTMFHMDLGYIRGPVNLNETVIGEAPGEIQVQSVDGHVAYLLIIDAATRFVWTFLLVDEHPPLSLIDHFLCRFGNPERTVITTDPSNILAKSKSWHQICKLRGYEPQLYSLDSPSSAPTMHNVIRTDNGTNLAGSAELREVVHNRGYIMEVTGTDASFQNGLAERPHRTLKERVRCLLYTAGLGTDFWSYALVHATWLYNRTFHGAIKMTPFEKWTRQKPTLDGLITFGSPVVTKKSGKRTSTLDPNTYQGIFLGYRSTCDNIIFYDIIGQRIATARHYNVDEYQYGERKDKRSPAGQHLLHTIIEETTDDDREEPAEETQQDWIYDTVDPILPDEVMQQTPVPPNKIRVLEQPLVPTIKYMSHSSIEDLTKDILQYDYTLTPYDKAIHEDIPISGIHPYLGIEGESHPDYNDTIILKRLYPGSAAQKQIKWWKSRLLGAIISKADDKEVTSMNDLSTVIQTARREHRKKITVVFTKPRWTAMTGQGIPQLHFDQMNYLGYVMDWLQTGEPAWNLEETTSPMEQITPKHGQEHPSATICKAKVKKARYRRKQLKETEHWEEFKKSEFNQLNKYHKQGMFGTPIPRPQPTPEDPKPMVLQWVWDYSFKLDPVKLTEHPKSRGTCNGSKLSGLAETFASCLDQAIHRLFWGIVASFNFVCMGCDVTNAFGEAPKPDQPFYMTVDEPFRE